MLTIAGSFWPRELDEHRFPVEAKLYRSAPEVRVLVHIQRPEGEPRGELILVHGLEGSSDGGYMRGMAQAALEAGFVTHRFNLRGCGGGEFLSPGMYHGGLTADLFHYLTDLDRDRRTPAYLVGFSLGGNVVLKLTGELAETGDRLLAGVCTVSTPLHLGVCARRIGERGNRLYERRFLRSMKRRVQLRNHVDPGSIPVTGLDRLRTLYDFDDKVTAPQSGFRDAEHYYSTQSAVNFLEAIRVPTLLIQSRDDPMIPFELYSHRAIAANPNIRLLATEHGGHLGFLSRSAPRFWLDETVIGWMVEKNQELRMGAVT